MKYVKAQNVLPDEVIEMIQNYIDGEYIYIPRKNGNELKWGEKSGTRESLKSRNVEIFSKYSEGASVEELIQDYYLSEQSIRRIIRQEKSLCS